MLWKQEIVQRRAQWPFGGRADNGRADEWRGRAKAVEAAVAAEVSNAAAAMPSRLSIDMTVAKSYGQVTIDELTVMDAGFFQQDVADQSGIGSGINVDEAQKKQDFDSLVSMTVSNQTAARDNGLLPFTTWQLLDDDLLGQVAFSHHSLDEAERCFRHGLETARAAHLPRAEVTFLLRLADMIAAPFGNVETLGMSLPAEYIFCFGIRMGRISPLIRPPEPARLDQAQAMYDDAATILRRLEGDKAQGILLIRRAYLLRCKSDWTAAARAYAVAAEAAEKDGEVVRAALALTAQALLSLDRDPFNRAADLLENAGDQCGLVALARCAESWAFRHVYLGHDPLKGISCVRMAVNAYRAHGVSVELRSLLLTESDFSVLFGQLDRAIELAQEAIPAMRQPAPGEAAKPADGGISKKTEDEWNAELMSLTTIVNALNQQYGLDGDPKWVARRKLLLDTIQECLGHAATNEQVAEVNRMLVAKLITGARWSDCFARVRAAMDTPRLRAVYQQALEQARSLNDPQLLIRLAVQVSGALPDTVEETTGNLEALQPIEKLRAAMAAAKTDRHPMRQVAINKAWDDLRGDRELALELKADKLLTRWLDAIEAAANSPDEDPAWKTLLTTVQIDRGIILLQQGNADGARQIFRQLLAGHSGAGPSVEESAYYGPLFRSTVLGRLLEAETRIADDPERALLIFVQSLQEARKIKGARTNFRGDQRASAELAMLERKAALEGGLAGADVQRKAELELLVRSTDHGDTVPNITLAELRRYVASLPKGTSVLTYYAGPEQVVGWKLSAEGIQMRRILATPQEVAQKADALHEIFAENLSQPWQADAAELHRLLIAPFEPFARDQPLVIVTSPLIAGIPFEMLGPAGGQPLIYEVPVVYANSLDLGKPLTQDQGWRKPTAAQVVTVGLNGVGLEKAEDEAAAVAKSFGARPIIGASATRQSLAGPLAQAKWVHLATHGVIDLHNPFRSSLVLADGSLEAWQLLQLAPVADTIVLSACNTQATGHFAAGLDADSSTLAAFAIADQARWIIASLWSANDRVAHDLVVDFSAAVAEKGASPPDAIRSAKAGLLRRGIPPAKVANLILMVANPMVLCCNEVPAGSK